MDVTTREYTVSGMTCGHCEQSVREEVGAVAGVQDVEVSVARGTLTVTLGAPVEDAAILAAVDDAGYSAVRVA